VGKTGRLALTNDLAWTLVRLHDHMRRIGSCDSSTRILSEASSALEDLIGAMGVAHYRLGPDGLVLENEAGRSEDAPPFPESLVVRSHMGGVLAGTPSDGDTKIASMVLGQGQDPNGHAALVELLRTGAEHQLAGVLWIRLAAADLEPPVHSAASALVDHVGIAQRNAQMLAEERRRAAVDELTGLLSRRQFMQEAKKELSRARRQGSVLSAMMLDVDHFKAVNDQHGHAAGDAVLSSLGGTLTEVTRETDIVGRLGGEEFVVLLPDTDRQGALMAAERLRHAVAITPVGTGESELMLTVSIGLAYWRSDEDTDSLLKRADGALYVAKDRGRNRIADEGT
jgi:diguanylate cyclase (GGDEF)-like protein